MFKNMQHHSHQVGVCAREVATLPGSQVSTILDLTQNKVIADFEDNDRDEAVVDEDPLARSQDLKLSNIVHQILNLTVDVT